MDKKVIIYIFIAFIILIILANMVNLVGFRYPYVIENEPLKSPIKIIRFEDSKLFLQDGQTVYLDSPDEILLSKQLGEADYTVDIEKSEHLILVYARVNGWICGTPWAQPIRIPIFRDTVYKNRRQMIAIGTKIEKIRQQEATPSVDKPLR